MPLPSQVGRGLQPGCCCQIHREMYCRTALCLFALLALFSQGQALDCYEMKALNAEEGSLHGLLVTQWEPVGLSLPSIKSGLQDPRNRMSTTVHGTVRTLLMTAESSDGRWACTTPSSPVGSSGPSQHHLAVCVHVRLERNFEVKHPLPFMSRPCRLG